MENLFFSENLTKKLERVKGCALSALEAPAGYGKTTAIRSLLRDSDAAVCWFTAVESMPDNSFRWFIRQLGMTDETAAQRLQDIGFLNRSNAEQAARILSELRPAVPLTLVFDNFQFALPNWQPQVLDALAKTGGGLRTIFISQNFGRLREPALPSREAAGHRMSGEAGIHGGGSGETSLRAARYLTSRIVAFSSNGPTGRPSAETRLQSG